MKIDWEKANKRPYDMIVKVINDWCEKKNYYSDMIVRLKSDDIIHTVYLMVNVESLTFGMEPSGWEWDYDWFEGGEVELLGFCPVDEVVIPDEFLLD